MKTNLSIDGKPMIVSFMVFGKLDREKLIEEKSITIDTSYETKTRLSTTFQFRDYRVGVNFQVDGFKTVEKEEWSLLSGDRYKSNYFVLSKKQGIEEYKNYVIGVVEKVLKIFKIELDEINVVLTLPKDLLNLTK